MFHTCRNNEQLTKLLETGKLNEVTLKGQTPQMKYKDDMVDGFINAIKSRFQTLSSGKAVIDATRILNLKHWPSDKDELRG